jgi:Cys-tRNA(Pro)/Cys-tRNA(Cys) deacylase
MQTHALEELSMSGLHYEIVRFPAPRDVAESAKLQGIEMSSIAKTIVVRRGPDDFLFVLVPGDRVIDWPRLRRHLGVSRLSLPDRAQAKEATGYEPGTITPFGAKTRWPVVCDATIAALDVVAIGGGARGVTVHIAGAALVQYLHAAIADVTHPDEVS